MRQRRRLVMALVLAFTGVVSTAAPASADSSSCTHHWSGPQVCIRLEGRNSWNSVTAIWVNPPKSVRARTVRLFMNGRQFADAQKAVRVGKTVSFTWSSMDTSTDTKLCVRFKVKLPCSTSAQHDPRRTYDSPGGGWSPVRIEAVRPQTLSLVGGRISPPARQPDNDGRVAGVGSLESAELGAPSVARYLA